MKFYQSGGSGAPVCCDAGLDVRADGSRENRRHGAGPDERVRARREVTVKNERTGDERTAVTSDTGHSSSDR